MFAGRQNNVAVAVARAGAELKAAAAAKNHTSAEFVAGESAVKAGEAVVVASVAQQMVAAAAVVAGEEVAPAQQMVPVVQ